MKSTPTRALPVLVAAALAAAGCSPSLESAEPSFTTVSPTAESSAPSTSAPTSAPSPTTSGAMSKNGTSSAEGGSNLTNPDGTYLITDKEPGKGKPERITQTWTGLDDHGFSKVTINVEKEAQNASMQFPFQKLDKPLLRGNSWDLPELFQQPYANILLTFQTWDLDGQESLTNSCQWDISALNADGEETLNDVMWGYEGSPTNKELFVPDEVPEVLGMGNFVRTSSTKVTEKQAKFYEPVAQDGCFGTIQAISTEPGEYTLEIKLAQKGFDPMIIHQPIRIAG